MNSTDRQICMAAWEGPGTGGPQAVAPPIYQTSIFTQPSFEEFVRQQAAEHENYVYSRGTNPTVAFLEDRLALLEGGEAAKCFGSGMGAIGAVLAGLLRSGDHVLFVNTIYGPTIELAQHLERFGVTHTVLTDPDADVEAHIRRNTALIYLESPGTMLMRVLDVPAVTAVARRHGIRTVMDNTWSTPLFQKPIAAGVDLVVHSLTKYLGGHSDVVGGAVIGSRDTIRDIFYQGHQLFGAAMSALEAALVLRGLRTLPVRMEQHQRSALAVVEYLRAHPEVVAVHHPYADHEPDEEILTRQFSGFSGLLSFELREGGFSRVARFIDGLNLFRIGPSWGGYESLVTSPVRPTADSTPSPWHGLVRLSLGLEGERSQIQDLDQALARVAEEPRVSSTSAEEKQ